MVLPSGRQGRFNKGEPGIVMAVEEDDWQHEFYDNLSGARLDLESRGLTTSLHNTDNLTAIRCNAGRFREECEKQK